MEKFRIKPVQTSDLPVIKHMEQAAFGKDAMGEDAIDFCFQPAMLFYTITFPNDPTPVGFGIAVTFQEFTEFHEPLDATNLQGKIAHIINFCIAQNLQHQGIGSALLKEFFIILKAHGYNIAYLEVQGQNTIAQRFYEKYGFQLQKTLPMYYRSGDDALIYVRFL